MGDALTLARLRDDIAEILDEPPGAIADDDNLLDRGLDSIRLMTLVERWRRAGVETSFLELADDPTVAGWWSLFSSKGTS